MDTKTSALVERLRGASVYEEYKAILSNLGDEAADIIEDLETRVIGLEAMLCDAQAEIERLRAGGAK